MNTLSITKKDLTTFVEEISRDWCLTTLVEICRDHGMFDNEDCTQEDPAVVYVDDVKVIENYEIVEDLD